MQEVSGSIPLFSTKKALYFVGSMVLFFFLTQKIGAALFRLHHFQAFAGGSVQPPVIGALAGQKEPVQLTISSICSNTSSIWRTSVNWVRARSRLWSGRAVWK